jgi:hypothetical protein
MIKNKKGEEARPVPALVLVIIAAIVLIIVYLFLFGPGQDLLQKIGIIVPTLNSTKQPAESVQLLRYDIQEDEVKFYDGINWLTFSSDTIKLGNIEISETMFKEDISINYWYKTGSREKIWIELSDKIRKEIRPKEASKFDGFVASVIQNEGYNTKKGDIRMILANQENSQTFGTIYYGNDEKMILETGEIDTTLIDEPEEPTEIKKGSKAYELLSPKLETWRDSVLKKPVTISYNKGDSSKYCVEEFDNRYLVIDLSKPTLETTC